MGNILINFLKKSFFLPQLIKTVAWTLSLLTIATTIYIPYTQYKNHTENILGYAFYVSLHRPIWALAIAWITFACIKGFGGPVNWFLSFPFYQPLAKLSYAIYLIHFPLKLQVAALHRSVEYFNLYLMFHFFLGVFCLSLLLAIPVVLMVEMPVANLETHVYKIFDKRKMAREEMKLTAL